MKFKKYRMVQLPVMAFFSRRLYRDIGRNWNGANFTYLFLLLAVCCVPFALNKRNALIQSLAANEASLINQIPDIHITDGEAHVKARMPYYIKNRDGEPIAIIDTTGSMNYIEHPSVQLMLTESKLIIRGGRHLFNTFDLSAVEDFSMDKHIANDWLSWIKNTTGPLSYAIFLMLSYIFAVTAMLFAAVVGLILSSLLHHSTLGFQSTMRLAVTASTPAILGLTVSTLLGLPIPPAVFPLVALIYLLLGIRSCMAKETLKEAERHIDLKAALQPRADRTYKQAA